LRVTRRECTACDKGDDLSPLSVEEWGNADENYAAARLGDLLEDALEVAFRTFATSTVREPPRSTASMLRNGSATSG
jgi:hypothetical protein